MSATHVVSTLDLHVIFEPIVSLDNSHAIAKEALPRWHSNNDWIRPGVAFANGANPEATSLKILSHVIHKNHRDPELTTVNMSPRLLESPHAIAYAAQACHSAGITPTQIVLEILETGPLVNIHAIHQWMDMGFLIALDDFGTGTSTPDRALQVAPSIIKVDRSYTKSRNACMYGTALTLANQVGAVVVAEGIETEADAAWVRSVGVDFGQGWLFPAVEPVRVI